MKAKELKEAVLLKNKIIQEQEKRITLLESKMTEIREKYYHLIYPDLKFGAPKGRFSIHH